MADFIKGKTIIITGGTSGFGLETARMLLARGANVVITGRDAVRLAAAQQELTHPNLLAIQADACVSADWKKTMAATIHRFGKLDVLVNNHGGGVRIAPLEDLTDEDIHKTLSVNIESVIFGCREAIKVMKANGGGHIVNVSSACAHHGWRGFSAYTAAKAGMVTFTRCLQVEMGQWGGKATCFIPGAARTNFCAAANIDDAWLEGYPDSADFAHGIVQCIDVPENCVIEEVRLWGTKQINDNIHPF
jgi:NAD(P)-dependent dehydrogenase (short-subunit alcohol dehydrogenase family)